MHDNCLKAEPGVSALVQDMGTTWWQSRLDQIMARTTLALHLLAFLPAAEPKLAIALSGVNHPAMCPGPVYNGLLTAKLGVSPGNQARSGGEGSGY